MRGREGEIVSGRQAGGRAGAAGGTGRVRTGPASGPDRSLGGGGAVRRLPVLSGRVDGGRKRPAHGGNGHRELMPRRSRKERLAGPQLGEDAPDRPHVDRRPKRHAHQHLHGQGSKRRAGWRRGEVAGRRGGEEAWRRGGGVAGSRGVGAKQGRDVREGSESGTTHSAWSAHGAGQHNGARSAHGAGQHTVLALRTARNSTMVLALSTAHLWGSVEKALDVKVVVVEAGLSPVHAVSKVDHLDAGAMVCERRRHRLEGAQVWGTGMRSWAGRHVRAAPGRRDGTKRMFSGLRSAWMSSSRWRKATADTS